jgi:predicted AlkP superfamily phosphohydrolase/phosphomutase
MEAFMTRAVRPLVLAWLVAVCSLGFVSHAGDRPKVVVLGFDGADSRLLERWMDEGELPNLAKLREEGSFAPLQPTNPPQTPVSWSSFATGTDPGSTEIFDFVRRNPANYSPEFAMSRDTRQPFLYGNRNGAVFGTIAAIATFVVLVLVGLLVLRRWVWRLLVAVALAALAGVGAGWVATKYLPLEITDTVNYRKGTTMWEAAAEAGLKVQVVRVPATYPAEDVGDGRMVSGLGVPDIRDRVGTPSFYTSDAAFVPGDDFKLEPIKLPARRGRIESRIVGRANRPFRDFVIDRQVSALPPGERRQARRELRRKFEDEGVPSRFDLPLILEATDTSLRIEASGQSATLEVGEWSDWFELTFPVNPVMDVVAPLRGISRFKLLRLEPELELYQSPVNFHPDCHPVAFSWPPEFSETLSERFGLYKTIGWALDTWSLPSGVGGEELFLEDMDTTVDQFAVVMRGLLEEGGQDLFVQIYYFTDRIAHLLWRYMDPGHPQFDPTKAERFRGEMLAAYKRMDSLVGEARALAGPEALFIVCSDHGFSSFRRGVNYNNWLVENGFMSLKPGTTGRPSLADVDWERTQAYAIGLGAIYVNLVGREKRGSVMPGPEYEEVRRRLVQGLEALVDESSGERPVSRVLRREEMYGDYDPDLIPDLRVSNTLNYRVSWATTLGGFGDGLIEDNMNPWSGDHASNDPDLVRGVFLSNRPINTDAPRMIDIMPSVLDVLGVAVPPEVEGQSLY